MLNSGVDLIYFLLDLLILCLHIFMLFAGFSEFILRNLQLLIVFPDLPLQTFHLHQEHIDVIMLQFFSLFQIFLRFLRLFLKRTKLLFQLSQNIIDTDQIALLFFQFAKR